MNFPDTLRIRRTMAVLAATLSLTACGQYGDLYLPPPEPAAEPGPAAPVESAPEPAADADQQQTAEEPEDN